MPTVVNLTSDTRLIFTAENISKAILQLTYKQQRSKDMKSNGGFQLTWRIVLLASRIFAVTSPKKSRGKKEERMFRSFLERHLISCTRQSIGWQDDHVVGSWTSFGGLSPKPQEFIRNLVQCLLTRLIFGGGARLAWILAFLGEKTPTLYTLKRDLLKVLHSAISRIFCPDIGTMLMHKKGFGWVG